jgi:hypothetical protein
VMAWYASREVNRRPVSFILRWSGSSSSSIPCKSERRAASWELAADVSRGRRHKSKFAWKTNWTDTLGLKVWEKRAAWVRKRGPSGSHWSNQKEVEAPWWRVAVSV